jgi:hypothetical protein
MEFKLEAIYNEKTQEVKLNIRADEISLYGYLTILGHIRQKIEDAAANAIAEDLIEQLTEEED